MADVALDFMQGGDAFAFEIAVTGFSEDGFGHKTILNAQRVFHRRAEILLNLTHTCHAQTIMLNHDLVNALGLSQMLAPIQYFCEVGAMRRMTTNNAKVLRYNLWLLLRSCDYSSTNGSTGSFGCH
jgi:hypothetical protein